MKVVVGVYTNLKDAEKIGLVDYELPQIPSVGDIIFANHLIEWQMFDKRGEWKINDPNLPLNYVRSIAYRENGTPIIMLGANPRHVQVNLFLNSNFLTSTSLFAIPNEGDIITVGNKNYYVIDKNYFEGSNVINIVLDNHYGGSLVYIAN